MQATLERVVSRIEDVVYASHGNNQNAPQWPFQTVQQFNDFEATLNDTKVFASFVGFKFNFYQINRDAKWGFQTPETLPSL